MSKGFCTHIKVEGVRCLGNDSMGELIHLNQWEEIVILGNYCNNSGITIPKPAFPNQHSQILHVSCTPGSVGTVVGVMLPGHSVTLSGLW